MKDTEVSKILDKEEARQGEVINLIASENYVSDDVREALGSVLVNKYAEGYPGARYYGGNIYADEVESLCQKRALELFGLKDEEWGANVQALSGSPANLAVYSAVMPKGGKIMGLELSHGGHLTHGHKASMTGKLYEQIPYHVSKDTELIDYDELEDLAIENKPDVIVAGYTAYSRIIDWERLRGIADKVGAHLHVDMSHIAGLVAGGVYPTPFPYADTVMTTTHKTLRGPRGAIIFSRKDERGIFEKIQKSVFPGLQGGPHMHTIAAIAVSLAEAKDESFKLYALNVIENAKALSSTLKEKGWRIISGGTDTHLFLVDTKKEGIDGARASNVLEKEGIVVNKNTIPFDTASPQTPFGIRLGTAAETTRGKGKEDMIKIAERIDSILRREINGN